MKAWTFVGALILAAFGVPALGNGITIYGAGSRSCGEFLADFRGDVIEAMRIENGDPVQQAYYLGWLQGYLSTMNMVSRFEGGEQKSVAMESAMLWVQNYCDSNPLDTFGSASAKLFIALD